MILFRCVNHITRPIYGGTVKVLHVCAVGVTTQSLLRPQIDYLLSRGLTVEVACSPDAEAEKFRQAGYTVHPVQIDREISPLKNLASLAALVRLMRSHHYDLVHVHTPIAAVLGRIAARIAGVPRVVYTAHGFPFHDQLPPWQYRRYFAIEKICAQLTDLILTQSYEDFLLSQQCLCPPDKVLHLNNGVDSQRFSRQQLEPEHQQALRQALQIPPQAGPVIGTIGRLTRQKGFDYLIDAAAQLLSEFPQLQVLIIGGELHTDPDPFQAELIQKTIDLGIRSHVTFTGFRQDIPQLLGLLDVFCLPTYFGEGLPRSILEAMAMGLPVVTTDIRGCREAVVPDANGWIVPPRDSQALADALQKLLASPQLRQRFGAASRRRVEAEFDERYVFQRIADSYESLGIRFPRPSVSQPPVLTSSSLSCHRRH